MVIGIANAIPGVSGGTMMVSMGIYDKLIHCLTHLFKEFKKSVKFVAPIILGAALGVVLLSAVIEKMFTFIPIQTNLLFIGLIVGGLPMMMNQIKGKKLGIGAILGFIIFFVLVVGLAALGETEGQAADVTFGFVNCIKLFGVGIVAAATMVIPGVSGSMMLMIMGYYQVIIETINDMVKALIHFDIPGILTGCGVLIPVAVGAIIGIFAIAKLVELLFEKAPTVAYSCIIGLIVASPVAIVLMNWDSFVANFGVVSILTGLLVLIVGIFGALKLGGE
ncbi:MAG: DUF368 domain-containing protein [Lachnospiraceae bacterium]|nr:DUF368 domain-containing protein [Lachnospiraceae bacterium]